MGAFFCGLVTVSAGSKNYSFVPGTLLPPVKGMRKNKCNSSNGIAVGCLKADWGEPGEA